MPTKLTIAKRARKQRGKAAPARLTLPQVVAIIEAVPEARRPLFWAWFFTQSRKTEIRAVLGRDYDAPRIRIERSAAGRSASSGIEDSTKTGHDGAYRLPEFVAELIEKHCTHVRFDEDAPLFRNPDARAGGPMWSDDAISDAWRAATASLGLPWVPPYQAMKHTQVTALRDAGMPVEDIVEQCRWAGPAMMEHYDQRGDNRRDAVVVKLAELAGRK